MKTVTMIEAKTRLDALLAAVDAGEEAIVIEEHGRPRAVLISASDWAALSAARAEGLRLSAWQDIRNLAAEASARNADLTEEEAVALADEIGAEAKRRVAARLAPG